MLHRKVLILLGLIILSSTVVSVCMLTRDNGWGDDFAGYILQAQGIVRGNMTEVVAKNIFTIEQSSYSLNPANYPWGFPLMLAPVYDVFGVKILAFKLVLTACYACFLVAFFLLARTRLTDFASLVLTAVLAYNAVLLQEGQGEVLSDIPFTLFSTIALWLIVRQQDAGPGSRDDVVQGILVGMGVFAGVFIRPNGFLLFAPLAATQLSRFRVGLRAGSSLRHATGFVALPYLTFGVLYVLQALVFPHSSLRNVSFSLTPQSVWATLWYYFWLPSYFWHQLGPTAKFMHLGLLIFYALSLMAHGRRDLPLHLYVLATLVLYVSFPYQQGARYLYPIWPVLLVFFLDGMKVAAGRLHPAHQRGAAGLAYAFWAGIAVVSLAISVQLAWMNMAAGRNTPGRWWGAFSPGSSAMFDFVSHHTPSNSAVIFFKARAMRLRSGRDSFETTDCLDLSRGDYVVTVKDNGTYNQISPEIVQSCNPAVALTAVYDRDNFIVYQISRVPQ